MYSPSNLMVQAGMFIGQTSNNVAESSEILIFQDITIAKILQATIIITLAYALLQISQKTNDWLSEKVARRFRLIVKQSLPFWRATIILGTGIWVARLFFQLSANNLLALTGTIAVALGFAFKDYASSLIAGIVALFEVPYRVGDRVQIGEHYGEIVNYGLRCIRLQTPADNLISIPHNKIWTEPISNANNGQLEALVVTDLYLAHEVDVDLVTKILYQAAYTSKYTQLKLPIVVDIEETIWGTHFQLKSYPMDARNEYFYKTDLLKRAKQALGRSEIAYPMGYPRENIED